MIMFIPFLVVEKFHHFFQTTVLFDPSFNKIEKAHAVSNPYRSLPAIIIKIPVGIAVQGETLILVRVILFSGFFSL